MPGGRVRGPGGSLSKASLGRPGGEGSGPKDAAGILNRRDPVESLGVGLLGMRERVRQLGGRLRIESSGRGATVQVEINLVSEAT